MAEIIRTEEHEPDPSVAPLSLIFGRDDHGVYNAELHFGEITPGQSISLLLEVVDLILRELPEDQRCIHTEFARSMVGAADQLINSCGAGEG